MQCIFDPFSQFAFNAAMMQCDQPCKIWSTVEKSLVPDLTHPSCINKYKRGPAVIDYGNYFINQFDPKMPGPWKFFNLIGKNRFHFDCFLQFGFDNGPLYPDSYRDSPGGGDFYDSAH